MLQKRFQGLGIHISHRYNAIYGEDDLLNMACSMSTNNQFATATAAALRRDARSRSGNGKNCMRTPSARWTLGKLAEVSPDHMQKWCHDNTQYVGRMASKNKMIQRGGMIAFDVTKIAYYGKGLREQMLKSKPKDGTARFDSYIVAHTVGQQYDVPIDDRRFTKDDNVAKILPQMLKTIDRRGLSPGLVLLDREFFSVRCINALKKDGRKFLMPAVKGSRIKDAIREHHNGRRNTASRFAIHNEHKESAEFNLLIVEKDGWDEEGDIVDRYVAFATNTPCRTKEELVETLPQTYRARWIIETGFRVIKDVKAKTCSNKLPIRRFLFCFALLLYSLWRMAKYDDICNGGGAGGERFTIKMFMHSMLDVIRNLLRWEKQHGNYLCI